MSYSLEGKTPAFPQSLMGLRVQTHARARQHSISVENKKESAGERGGRKKEINVPFIRVVNLYILVICIYHFTTVFTIRRATHRLSLIAIFFGVTFTIIINIEIK